MYINIHFFQRKKIRITMMDKKRNSINLVEFSATMLLHLVGFTIQETRKFYNNSVLEILAK